MKKSGLLFSMALASMLGASAQSVKINDLTLKPGESGFITVTFDNEVLWEDAVNLEVRLLLPAGVTVGSVDDADFGGIMENPTDFTKALNVYEKAQDRYFSFMAVSGETKFKEMASEVTVKIPVIVAEDAEEGVFELTPDFENDTDETLMVGSTDFVYDETYTTGKLTISASATPIVYAAKVYSSTGVADVNVATVAELEALLGGNNIVAFGAGVPSDFAEYENVIIDGLAATIILSNDAPYTYTGPAFTANSVEFTYNFATKASKAGGWNSLAIPFTGTPNVDPFTTADKENGKFWAKEFVSATESGLEFADLASAQFVANKSYIVAFPGESYGSNEFVGNSIVISATGATVVQPSTSVKAAEATPFTMKTIYAGQAPKDSYVLDPALNKFVKQDAAADVKPFQAYAIASSSAAPALRSLAILDANKGLTSVEAVAANAGVVVYANEGDIVINANESGVASVYNMNGQVVKANVKYNEGETRIAGLAAGAYVVAGQVVVLK